MNYPGIRIEGAILSPDILDQLEELNGQRPPDFGLESSVKVKDEIARAWADGQDYWRIFHRKLESIKPDSPATTETRNLWIVPLLGLMGYQLEYKAKSTECNGKNFNISHRALNRGNIPVQIIGYHEPAGLDRKPEKAGLRMSAHAMIQEYLNLSEQLYAIVTNGRLLRLLRDSSRLVKLTYLEFDLDRIFTDNLFADFAILFRLLHASRLPASEDNPSESLIEKYHQDSLESGARIREGLSMAVERAILDFANGFLEHPENETLRNAITSGQLKPEAYYQSLLRLIYRILFLLVIEERNLVYPLSPSTTKRDLYYRYYSLQRLRRLSERRFLVDRRKHDLWLSLLASFRLFEPGGPGQKLEIAPLGGDLFGSDAIGLINQCTLGNDVLLNCLRSLGLYQNPDTGQIIRVNYAALNVEEFGSVYEGLLEYDPVFMTGNNKVEFVFARGEGRAVSGSHYTPDDLVQPLLKHSLDHLIAEKLQEVEPVKALLSLRVADIACGSGHILLAAARRIATELAVLRTGDDQPSPEAFRIAVRDVIQNCIYGVDFNPLAVELCKVALWLEAHNPGEPLNFLDHHIKCGNAIVGFVRREDLERGVPDEAFKTLKEDDKEIASIYRKQNKKERAAPKQQELEFSPEVKKHMKAILQKWGEVSKLEEHTPEEIVKKKKKYLELTNSKDTWFLNQIAGIPIAQFYLPKTPENESKFITDSEFRHYWSGNRHPQGPGTASAWSVANERRFFHWFLEFPEIIEGGGFDCILGNPPYLNEKRLTTSYGRFFLNYLKWEYAPVLAIDLVGYFFRRIFQLIKNGGFQSLIATNTISQGNTREGGLQFITSNNGEINFAVKSTKWPGKAAVQVSLVGIFKGEWNRDCLLNGKVCKNITSYLDDEESSPPLRLIENKDKSFSGSYVLGKGFILSKEDAKQLLLANDKNHTVVIPYLNGDDLNSNPDQSPRRWIINFYNWELEKIQKYTDVYPIIEKNVKPERTRVDDDGNYILRRPLPQKWWMYADKRPKLYKTIQELPSFLICSRVTKYLNFVMLKPSMTVFDIAVNVFALSKYSEFAIVQSTLHNEWVRREASTLETRLRYTPSDVFETFPFPELENHSDITLESIGENYHQFRKNLMLRLWLGLTDIYNLFHTRDLTPEQVSKVSKKPEEAEAGFQGVQELRSLHREMDQEVLSAYGWSDLDLRHDFHEVETLPENDRVRYTIHPDARKELLRHLLELNHQRAAEEEEQKEKSKKSGKKKPKTAPSDSAQAPLFKE